ncbi:unnamed protein product [Phytophthora lilii]|uniref:Unnamed protein product n=1 Tax=Phytophthora lilii TaxID=2077276 RepID=A0A9W6TZV6_9STRA|nr:unnamed protein product [Phytophthora lilii]
MLAKERKDWPTHVVALKNSLGKLPLTIGKVLEFVAKLKKMQDVEDMTVIFCVDGLQHVENDDFCTLSRIVKAICCFLNSSRVFTVWVCSATAERSVSEVLGKCTQQRVYLLLPPLRGHEIITPKTEMEKQLVDDMGGHGRALEILQEVLEKHRKVALADVDPAIIVADVYRELENRCNIFDTSFFSDPTNCQEVLTGILSRRKYYQFELIGQHTNMTVDWLQNIGFIRYTPDKRLECPFIILMMLMKSIPKKPGDEDYADNQIKRLALGWQPFEQFVAFHRRVKSIAFSGYPVLLSAFHAGARFGATDRLLIHEEVPRTVVKAVSQLETKSGSKDSLIRTEHHGSVDISTMSTVVVNADHAAAGDIFMRVHLTDGNRQIHSNEVIQCKFTERNQKIDRAYYEKERTKAVNNASDVFLLIAPSDLVEPFDLRKRCGIVSKAEFNDYFGPFASRAYRSLFEAPDINNASYQELRLIEGVGDAIAAKIIAKRNRKRFSSHDDAIERLFKNRKCKTADILRELNCSPKAGQ